MEYYFCEGLFLIRYTYSRILESPLQMYRFFVIPGFDNHFISFLLILFQGDFEAGKYRCLICNKEFNSESGVKYHINSVHSQVTT